MAAGATQTHRIPCVVDLDLVGVGEHQARDRRVLAVDEAAAHQPVGVGAAARERPTPGDAEAVVHARGPAERGEHTARDRPRLRIDLPRRGLRDVARQEPTRGVDGRAPARSPVAARERLDRLDQHRGMLLQAAGRARHAEAENAGVRHLGHELRGQPALALCFDCEVGGPVGDVHWGQA